MIVTQGYNKNAQRFFVSYSQNVNVEYPLLIFNAGCCLKNIAFYKESPKGLCRLALFIK
jgi:hypothetical protein